MNEAHSDSLAIFPFVSCYVPQKQPCDAEAYGECKVWTIMSARFGGNPSTCGSNDSQQSKCWLLGRGFFILAEVK